MGFTRLTCLQKHNLTLKIYSGYAPDCKPQFRKPLSIVCQQIKQVIMMTNGRTATVNGMLVDEWNYPL